MILYFIHNTLLLCPFIKNKRKNNPFLFPVFIEINGLKMGSEEEQAKSLSEKALDAAQYQHNIDPSPKKSDSLPWISGRFAMSLIIFQAENKFYSDPNNS